MRCAILLFAIATVGWPLEAQKNCKTGKPCGNTCISRDKVCHIGTAPPPPPTAPTSANGSGSTSGARNLATTASAPVPAAELSPNLAIIAAGDSTWPYAGGRRLDVYYPNDTIACAYLRRIAPSERLYFRTREEARAYGLLPSLNPGCK